MTVESGTLLSVLKKQDGTLEINLLIGKDVSLKDALLGMEKEVNARRGDADRFVVRVFDDKDAPRYDGWLVKGEFSNGKAKYSTDNDVETKRALFEEYMS